MTKLKQRGDGGVDVLLRSLRLPSFVAYHEEIRSKAEKQGWTFSQYLYHLSELELADREQRRTKRMLKQSKLPSSKTLATMNLDRLPTKVRRQVPTLCEGGFVEQAENVLFFGLPGRGKTHLACAIGHELVKRGYSVIFTRTYKLVQQLLAAKRDLVLEKMLSRLDRYDVIICDDLGYVQQERDEMEVLFTFLGERYERRSVMITSNLVFSKWDRIFKDPMTTAAAIDRVVHHSTILELMGPSIRSEVAMARNHENSTKHGKKNGGRTISP